MSGIRDPEKRPLYVDRKNGRFFAEPVLGTPWKEVSVGQTYTAGDGLDLSSGEFSVDLKAAGGLVIETGELAVDLSAGSITGTLAVGDGGTGQTTYSSGQLLIGNAAGGLTKASLTAGSNITITPGDGSITIAAASAPFTQAGTGAVARTVESKLRDVVSVKDFGTVGDGVTDDTAAIQAAIDAVHIAGGGTVTFTDRHLINNNLLIKENVSLRGPLELPDEILPANQADYDGKRGVLLVNSASTITLEDSAALSNCIILRKGLDLPFPDASAATAGVAAFAGTAITVGGAGAYCHHLLILGFNKAIRSSGYERLRAEYINIDCTNGIELLAVYDVAYIENCHAWPWTTTHQSWTTNTLITRTGVAFDLRTISGSNDWSILANCFAYGFLGGGFLLENCSDVRLNFCGYDAPGPISNTVVAFSIKGSDKIILTSPISSQAGTAIRIENATGSSTGYAASNNVRIDNANLFDSDVHHIHIVSGSATITGAMLLNSPQGVFSDSVHGFTLANSVFSNVTNPIVVGSGFAKTEKIYLSNNIYQDCSTSYSQLRQHYYGSSNANIHTVFGGTGLSVQARLASGTPDSPTYPGNDTLYEVTGYCPAGSPITGWNPSGRIKIQAQGSPGATNSGGTLIFSTTATTTTSLIDRLKLSDQGGFFPLTDNAYDMGVGAFRWKNIFAANGTIQTSDSRYKDSVTNCSLGLGFINSLRPVSYRWKEGEQVVIKQIYRGPDGAECDLQAEGATAAEIISESVPGQRTHWGLIAQEVKDAADAAGVDFGGWVLVDKDNHESQQALRYDQFIAPLIKAVQELSTEVEQLKAQLQSTPTA